MTEFAGRTAVVTGGGSGIARRAAEAATEIEHVHASPYLRPFRMLPRSHDAPAVQLVVRPQIAIARRLGIYSSRSKGVVDAGQ
jgi:hypothetical protein